jgi:quercetin dioxygenase-like cupin family protein
MPSLDRPLSGSPLRVSLREDGREEHIDAGLLRRSGRSARTLIRDGPLRVTLVALAAGGSLSEHRADGPITVHVLSGSLRFRIGEDEHTLYVGDLLSVSSGVSHAVDSVDGAVFLLTVAAVQQP